MFRQIALWSVGLIALGIATLSQAASGLESAMVSSPINVSQAELEIRTALAEKVNLEFNDTPLTAVMTFIHDKYHLQFQFDTAGLAYTNQGQTVKIDPAKLPVTINLKNVTLRSALNLILSPHNLAWTIKDEVLLVTTQEEAASMLETAHLRCARSGGSRHRPQRHAGFRPPDRHHSHHRQSAKLGHRRRARHDLGLCQQRHRGTGHLAKLRRSGTGRESASKAAHAQTGARCSPMNGDGFHLGWARQNP